MQWIHSHISSSQNSASRVWMNLILHRASNSNKKSSSEEPYFRTHCLAVKMETNSMVARWMLVGVASCKHMHTIVESAHPYFKNPKKSCNIHVYMIFWTSIRSNSKFQDPPDRNILQAAGPQLAVESNWSSEGKDGCFFFFRFTLANGSCSIQTTLKMNES